MKEKADISDYRESAAYLMSRLPWEPELAVVLGSGLGAYAQDEAVVTRMTVPYADIPHFPTATNLHQSGILSAVEVGGKRVLLFNGRFHYYEGWEMWQTAYPVAVCKLLGVRALILTNAAGGIHPEKINVGDIAVITDHIKLAPDSPDRGKNLDALGSRFFDMQSVYDKNLISIAEVCAGMCGFTLKRGVYGYMAGPQFETPAEIRMLGILGCDLVGMSTVAEVIEAAHCSIPVLALSCVSNLAAGITGDAMSLEEVMETGERVSRRFSALLTGIIEKI